MELKDKKINVLGDSITEGSGASSTEKRFADLLSKDTGAVVRNYGIGGTRYAKQATPSANERHDLDFCQRALEMDPDADIVLVFGGTNDYGHGDAPIGTPDDRTPETFYGAAHTLYRTLRERYINSTIIILTPLHRSNENNPLGDGSKKTPCPPLKKYVEIIREVAEYYGLPVLDLYKVSGMQPEVPVIKEMFMPDGLHPNDAGYRRLADTIISYLRNF